MNCCFMRNDKLKDSSNITFKMFILPSSKVEKRKDIHNTVEIKNRSKTAVINIGQRLQYICLI
jgi:hypothetical protein